MSTASIIPILKRDHREVSALFEKAAATGDAALAKRTTLFGKIKDALTLHMRFEEDHLYPVLKAKKGTKDDVLEAVEEHDQAKHLIAALTKLDTSDERWKAKITVLHEDIKHHVKEEEQKGGLFDELKRELDDEELEELAEQYTAMKAE